MVFCLNTTGFDIMTELLAELAGHSFLLARVARDLSIPKCLKFGDGPSGQPGGSSISSVNNLM